MKKALSILVALCMLCCSGPQFMHVVPRAKADASCEGLVPDTSVEGIIRRPADESQVAFDIEYKLPQWVNVSSAAESINQFFGEMQNQLPEIFLLDDGIITYEITHSSERYVSVLLSMLPGENIGGTAEVHGFTFALDGIYEGKRLSLSEILGLEQQNELGEILPALSRNLIWQVIEHESLKTDHDYFDGLTRDRLDEVFNPEDDFYLDADGNIVFYVQAGEIAAEIAGILTFPYNPSEMIESFGNEQKERD